MFANSLFSEDELKLVSAKLESKRLSLKRMLQRHEKIQLRELAPQSSGEVAPTPFHQADHGSDAGEQGTYSSLVEREIKEIQEIEDALFRIHKGLYGFCEDCDQPISKLRLEQVPEARFCGPCETKAEKINKERNRRSFSQRPDYNYTNRQP